MYLGRSRVLERRSEIREVAVVGVYDDRLGEVPIAVYEFSEGAKASGESGENEKMELVGFAQEDLTRCFVPAPIRAADAIRRTLSTNPSLLAS